MNYFINDTIKRVHHFLIDIEYAKPKGLKSFNI
jgi:hypothetical protein